MKTKLKFPLANWNCGCQADCDNQDGCYTVTNFCPEHDPTAEQE